MNKVVVKVLGNQKDIYGEENKIEVVSVGKHYCKNDVHSVLYNDSESLGVDHTSTLLKIDKDNVTLIRKGKVEQTQFFKKLETSSSNYKTPFGNMRLTVLTKELDIAFGTVTGEIVIDYELAIDGQWQSENELRINISTENVADNLN